MMLSACHCGHSELWHQSPGPYGCRYGDCPCGGFRWDRVPLATWRGWARLPDGRPEWGDV